MTMVLEAKAFEDGNCLRLISQEKWAKLLSSPKCFFSLRKKIAEISGKLILFFAKKCVSRVAKRMAPNSKMRRGSASAYTHIAHYQEKKLVAWDDCRGHTWNGTSEKKRSSKKWRRSLNRNIEPNSRQEK
jgi:hypothetical protein